MKKTSSGPLKEGEIMTPLRGYAPSIIEGDGDLDLWSGIFREKELVSSYVNIELKFYYGEDKDERDDESYAEIHLSNFLNILRPSDDREIINLKTGEVSPPEGTIEFPEAPPTELEEKIIKCSNLLAEILREKIKRGGKFGGEISYQNYRETLA